MRIRRLLTVACTGGLLLTLAAAPAGAGKQTTTPVSLTINGDQATGTDVVGDGAAYQATLSGGGSLEMRLPAPRRLTVYLGARELKCQPAPYWSKIWVFTVSPGLADARIDCAVTASGEFDGRAATPWLIDFPPYKYGPSPAPCVVVSGNSYSASGCQAKAYAGGFRRAGYDYLGPVDFSFTTS